MRATLIHHQGFGDLFTNNSLCNFFSEKYDELLILVQDEKRKKILDYVYHDNHKIKCEVVKTLNENKFNSCCINCMTLGNPLGCPKDGSDCIYVNYDEYPNYNHIKIGAFKENYNEWDIFLKNNQSNGKSFSHSFYEYENLDLSVRINFFNLSRNKKIEENKFSKLNLSEYIVLHDDKNRNKVINKEISDLKIYELNGSSDVFIDQIKILENAKEIHFIDSSWSVLIYFLSFHNEKIKLIPKFLHCYLHNDRDLEIYKNPIPENWNFIY
jgi:hypothetical protein